MQTSYFQRFREWLLQTLQLQELSKRSILQRNSQRYDPCLSQIPQRILRNLGRNHLPLQFRLHVLELVYLKKFILS